MQYTPSRVTVNENKEQIDQHGFFSFPIAFYKTDLVRDEVIWHWHDDIEIVQVLEGRILAGMESNSVETKAGEGFFIKPGVLHRTWKLDDAPLWYRTIVFSPRLIGGIDSCFWSTYVQPTLQSDFPSFIRFSQDSEPPFSALMDAVWKAKQDSLPGFENDIRYILTKFLMYAVGMAPVHETVLSAQDARDMERVKRMLTFLQSHFAEDITLDQIAASAALSRAECIRCFQRMVGSAPMHFLKEYRMQRAAALLRSTNLTVSEVALNCGVPNAGYFTRMFRSLYNQTPTQYRAMPGDDEAAGVLHVKQKLPDMFLING